MRLKILFSFLLLLLGTPALADNKPEEASPPEIGNFILPNAQQPGPMIGFGENIVNKGDSIAYLFGDKYTGNHQHYTDLIPSLLYGISDNLSLLLNLPVAASYQYNRHHSSGLENASAQFEYAYYNHSTRQFTDQATIAVSVSVPTGSSNKNPATGVASPAFFIGTTLNRTLIEWFVFTGYGVILNTTNNINHAGNQFLYQAGLGKNVKTIGKDWIIAWMLEADGTYSGRDHTNDLAVPNTGGNIVYVTPSLWVSSKKMIFQLGVGLPMTQRWYGHQNTYTYLLAANFGWTLS